MKTPPLNYKPFRDAIDVLDTIKGHFNMAYVKPSISLANYILKVSKDSNHPNMVIVGENGVYEGCQSTYYKICMEGGGVITGMRLTELIEN